MTLSLSPEAAAKVRARIGLPQLKAEAAPIVSRAEATRALQTRLVATFPACFAAVRPLKIGICEDLLAISPPIASRISRNSTAAEVPARLCSFGMENIISSPPTFSERASSGTGLDRARGTFHVRPSG